MEVVTLKVKVDKSQVTTLQAELAKLQSKSVKIRVDASGFAALDKSIVKNINSVTKFVNAAAKLERSQAQVRIAQERTAQATQRRMTAENQLATQQARLATEAQRTATQEARLATQTEKTATEEARLATQTEKTATAQAKAATQAGKTATERAKLATQTQRTATEEVRLATQQERTRTAQAQGAAAAQRASASRQQLARSTNEATKSTQGLMTSLASSAKSMGQAMVTAALIYKPVQAFKDALETMKAVDAELVNVGKVTKWPEERLKDMGEQAYKTASAYGVAADAYLTSMTEFTRAGYLDRAEDMGELAVKTQIVGDTTADIANQFLLAVDAAYKYQGSTEKLSAVLDGVNEIGNNFATSIPKIAEGLGKVAPIAAQGHVGIDELSASLGTITAVTQRSGTEAATALRALMLNIMGDTKTEIDEGVTWTTGEIAGLRDVLKIYASDVVEAADATGTLINPMEAIGALAKSMKDGVLTEQKLMEMVSDIGGKLRTSQLLALVQNWDMYEDMLDKYHNAAGSADREVERAMDSWGRKTEVLKNTWTQFVSHMVETDAIKGAITGVTEVIDALDSDLGHTAMGMVGMATAVSLLGKAGKGLAGTGLVRAFKDFFLLTKEFGVAESAMATFGTFFKTNPIFTGAIAAAGLYALIKGLREIAPTVENARKELEGLQNQLEEKYGVGSEYEDLMSRIGSLNEAEKRRLTILQAQKGILEQQVKDAEKLEFERFQSSLGIGDERTEAAGKTLDYARLSKFNKVQDQLTESFLAGDISAKEYRAELGDLATEMEEYYNSLKKYSDSGFELTESQKAMIEAYENMLTMLGTSEDAALAAAVALEKFQNTAEMGGKTAINKEVLQKNLQEIGATKEEIENTIAAMQADDTLLVFSITADTNEVINSLKELEIARENASGEIEIDYKAFSQFAGELGYSKEEISGFVQKAQELDGVHFSGVVNEIRDLEQQLDGGPVVEVTKEIEGLKNAAGDMGGTLAEANNQLNVLRGNDSLQTLGEQAQGTKKKSDEVKGSLQELGKTKAQPKIQLQDNDAQAKLEAIAAKINALPRTKTITIQANPIGFAASSVFGAIGKMFASGTENAPGGKAMVNELGPEIIREGGRARIAGGGKPTITTLERGAQVFTAEETQTILAGKEADIPIPAFSKGTGLSKYFNVGGTKESEGTPQSSSSSSGTKNTTTQKGNSKKSTSRSGKASGSGSGGEDAKLEALQNDLELLKAQYSFLEASGAGADALAAKSREIQAALNNINNHLRATNGEQKDILANSTDWWKELENIQKVQQEAFEKQRDLMESQLELMEKQGASAGDRISKLKEIQSNLHEEAEYLRSIGAAQEEINELSIEWWNVQEEIAKVQQDLWDELDEAVAAELKRAQIARDEEIDALDRRLQEMKDARNAKEDELTLEEKLLKVEEARAALENAQNERTIRTYNASSGQWEWVADAKSVEDAKKNLEEAEKDLEEYRADLAYEEAVKAIERRKEAINAAYDALEEGWEDIIESVQEPTREIGDILADLAKNGTPLMKEQVENTRRLLEDLNNYISSAISTNTGDSFYGANGSLGMFGAGSGLSSKDYSKDTTDYSALMYRAKDLAEFNYWAEQRSNKMAAQGIDPTAAGFKTNSEIFKEWESGKQKGEQSSGSTKRPTTSSGSSSSSLRPSGSSGSSSGGNRVVKVTSDGSAPKGLGVGDSVVTGGGTYTITGVNKDGSYNSIKSSNTTTQTYKGKYDKYDQGGVLRGLGGIKATAENEMVLPPDITAKLLAPTSNEVFEQRMKELGFLYGAPSLNMPASPHGASTGGATYNNGDTYQYGNITLTEQQAKGMTVYELAQKARNLSLFAGR